MEGLEVRRIADAMERIANALEGQAKNADPTSSKMSFDATVILDGRVIARQVVRHMLQKAARGPSSLVGGPLVTGASDERP